MAGSKVVKKPKAPLGQNNASKVRNGGKIDKRREQQPAISERQIRRFIHGAANAVDDKLDADERHNTVDTDGPANAISEHGLLSNASQQSIENHPEKIERAANIVSDRQVFAAPNQTRPLQVLKSLSPEKMVDFTAPASKALKTSSVKAAESRPAKLPSADIASATHSAPVTPDSRKRKFSDINQAPIDNEPADFGSVLDELRARSVRLRKVQLSRCDHDYAIQLTRLEHPADQSCLTNKAIDPSLNHFRVPKRLCTIG
jgi:hypothetical protein